jgi:flagellar export protein FliJ
MTPFRFRASAALDLRRKEEDSARLRLAQAQSALQQTEARVVAAQAAVRTAAEQLQAEHQHGTEAWRLGWHQSWIHRLRLEASTCRRTVAVSVTTVEHAAASVQTAHQRRRALERLRDRSWRRHQLESGRQETRDMNLLANLRYLAQTAGGGGTHGDD